ncbi:MAG: hypothetical protein M1381_12345 [Deltaproteobacteria bacterium]|nr:hypothetical protein [Deltaproteobacteria bacterium]
MITVEKLQGRTIKTVVISFFLLIAMPAYAHQTATCKMTVYFSPLDNMVTSIHQALMSAHRSVYCSLYGITNRYLAHDLMTIERTGINLFRIYQCLNSEQM